MRRYTIKNFTTGFLTATMIFAMSSTSFAASLKKSVELSYNNIKIVLNGKAVTPTDANGKTLEPFIIDGTTYLPVRGIANALNLDVSWDNATSTVTLKNKTSEQLTNENLFSRSNPAPICTEQVINIKNYSEEYTATINIMESYRGDEAWSRIKSDTYNSEAPAGKEYVLVKVLASVANVKDDKAISFNSYSFDLYSSNNVEYSLWDTYADAPTPEFSSTLYEGGILEGYIVYLIDKNDISPKVVFGKNYDGTGGIWFKLTK